MSASVVPAPSRRKDDDDNINDTFILQCGARCRTATALHCYIHNACPAAWFFGQVVDGLQMY